MPLPCETCGGCGDNRKKEQVERMAPFSDLQSRRLMRHNSVEKLSLKDQQKQTLEEARVVLPGIQALFGFQLIAVFNQGFAKLLNPVEQRMHLGAIALSALGTVIIMAPAALHRQSEPDSVSDRLVKVCTALLTAGLVPIMVAIPLDFYLIARIILQDSRQAFGLGVSLLAVILILWFVFPAATRRYLKRPSA